MTDKYITLLGAEQVAQAARTMQNAADTIERSVGNMEHSLFQHAQRMESLIERLEALKSDPTVPDKPVPLMPPCSMCEAPAGVECGCY